MHFDLGVTEQKKNGQSVGWYKEMEERNRKK